jgi:mono/diheme cytochrome c family protein
MRHLFRALLIVLLAVMLLGGVVAFTVARRGLGTRSEPSRAEAVLAWAMRRLATPQAVKRRANPVPPTADVLEQALAHYADHCAGCHANDGSGATDLGRSFYPKAPDMRSAGTQALSDGELFSIIEHGIRLTGMPAWGTGTPEGERDSWGLVHFIRRLPSLTPEDVERMEALNPRTAAEWKSEDEARRFLAGEPVDASGH